MERGRGGGGAGEAVAYGVRGCGHALFLAAAGDGVGGPGEEGVVVDPRADFAGEAEEGGFGVGLRFGWWEDEVLRHGEGGREFSSVGDGEACDGSSVGLVGVGSVAVLGVLRGC